MPNGVKNQGSQRQELWQGDRAEGRLEEFMCLRLSDPRRHPGRTAPIGTPCTVSTEQRGSGAPSEQRYPAFSEAKQKSLKCQPSGSCDCSHKPMAEKEYRS